MIYVGFIKVLIVYVCLLGYLKRTQTCFVDICSYQITEKRK